MEKDIDVTSPEGLKAAVADVKVYGDPSFWICIAKAWSHEKNWMHSTKVCLVRGAGLLVQTSTEMGSQGEKASSQAVAFVPGVFLQGRTYQGAILYEIEASRTGDHAPGTFHLNGVRQLGKYEKEPADAAKRT